jgi:hypothetical protein
MSIIHEFISSTSLHNILPKQEAFAMRDVDVPSMACSKQKK